MDCSGDSSNGGHEDCTEVHSGRGMLWNDLDCIQTRPYVCGYSRSFNPVGVPPGEGPVDSNSLVGNKFSCTGAKQTYTATVDGPVTVWMSGAGGGFGTLAHPPQTGGAAGVSYGSWSLNAGESMDVSPCESVVVVYLYVYIATVMY